MPDGTQQRDGASVSASYRTAYESGITDDSADRLVVFDSSGTSDLTELDVGRYAFAHISGASTTQNTSVTVEYKNHHQQSAWRTATLTNGTLTAGSGETDILGSETEAQNISGAVVLRVKTTVTTGGTAGIFVHLES